MASITRVEMAEDVEEKPLDGDGIGIMAGVHERLGLRFGLRLHSIVTAAIVAIVLIEVRLEA